MSDAEYMWHSQRLDHEAEVLKEDIRKIEADNQAMEEHMKFLREECRRMRARCHLLWERLQRLFDEADEAELVEMEMDEGL